MLPPTRSDSRDGNGVTVTSTLLPAYVFMVLLIGHRLAGLYFGGSYVCPSCGTRKADQHASECPWDR
jgi:hypothetical protein